jgi:hypothetical protein
VRRSFRPEVLGSPRFALCPRMTEQEAAAASSSGVPKPSHYTGERSRILGRATRLLGRGAGVDIAYEVVGEGTPLTLLHFLFDTREFWWRSGYVDAFRGTGRQLILVDASGHGESALCP